MAKALALSRVWWGRWLEHVRQTAGSRMFAIIWLTSALACRAGEVVCLQRGRKSNDIYLDGTVIDDTPTVNVRGGKTPGRVYVRPEFVKDFRLMLKHGVITDRQVKTKHGKRTRKDVYMVPKSGYIFKARAKSKAKHLGYHAVWAAVEKCAKTFHKKFPGNDLDKIRTHSGRTSAITTMLGEGVPIRLSMKIARHADASYRLHLEYAQATNLDVHAHFVAKENAAAEPIASKTNEARTKNPSSVDDLAKIIGWCEKGLLKPSEFARAKSMVLQAD